MASPLPGSGPVASSGTCDRQFRLHGQNSRARPRRNVDIAKECAQGYARVRPSSASCQACTNSGAPGDGHETSCSSSQFGVAASSSNSSSGNANNDLQASSSGWSGCLQPQQYNSSQPVRVAPGSQPLGTVVICGWLGSNKRYLKRYQDWWSQNRC